VTTVIIKIKPGAKRETITILDDGSLAVAVNAPPIEGRANCRLIALLSKALHIPKSSIALIRGEKSRIKVVAVGGLEKQDVYERLKVANA
jgi:hypothetical protein